MSKLGVALHLLVSPDGEDRPDLLGRLLDLAIADSRIDFVELGPVEDAGARRELRGLLRMAGVELVFNTGPAIWGEKLDFAAAEATLRSHALSRVAQLITQAHELDAVVVQVSPGPDRPDRQLALRRTAEAFRTLSEEAGPRPFACEVYDRDAFARRLVGPTETAAELVELVDHDGFGLLLDTSHLMLQGEVPEAAVAALSEHVVHAHVANCVTRAGAARAGDEHPFFGIDGGVVGPAVARDFVAALGRSGYLDDPARGRIAVEIKRADGEDPAALLAGGFRFLRRAAS